MKLEQIDQNIKTNKEFKTTFKISRNYLMTRLIKYSFIYLIIISFISCSKHQPLWKGYSRGAEIFSEQDYLFGKFEIRMKMTKGDGIVSSFYLYPKDDQLENIIQNEIDIEILGNNTNGFHSDLYNFQNTKTIYESFDFHDLDIDLSADYHTYTIEWTPTYIKWRLDGELIRTISDTGVTAGAQTASNLRFDLWETNPENHNWAGKLKRSSLPSYMYVNWIKYYNYTPDSDSIFTYNWTDDFNTLEESVWHKAGWKHRGSIFVEENAIVQDGYLILCLTQKNTLGHKGAISLDQ